MDLYERAAISHVKVESLAARRADAYDLFRYECENWKHHRYYMEREDSLIDNLAVLFPEDHDFDLNDLVNAEAEYIAATDAYKKEVAKYNELMRKIREREKNRSKKQHHKRRPQRKRSPRH